MNPGYELIKTEFKFDWDGISRGKKVSIIVAVALKMRS